MKRTPLTSNLTKAFIESNIPQEKIMAKYLNLDVNVIKKCIETNTLITSVFRDNDTNSSMGFAYNKHGKLKVRDFGGAGQFMDIYDTVAYVLSIAYERPINTNNKRDFYFILTHIYKTFSKEINDKKYKEEIDEDIIKGLSKIKQRRPIIEIVPRSWNKSDRDYWGKLGVSLGYLNTHFVIPVDQYYIDRGVNIEPKYYYKQKDPCYAYMLGQNRQGIHFIKLYFPNRNRTTELKFITNCNVLEGLLNLELNNYDYILITKSSKDRLSIGGHLDTIPFYGGANAKLNIGIINLPSENYHLTEKEYSWLTNKLAPNGKIISLLDFDYTGRCGAKYLYETYDIPYMFITRGEFGLPNYHCKDFTDLHDKYTIKEINQFINETITYVTLRFKCGYDTTSDLSELPYFM